MKQWTKLKILTIVTILHLFFCCIFVINERERIENVMMRDMRDRPKMDRPPVQMDVKLIKPSTLVSRKITNYPTNSCK